MDSALTNRVDDLEARLAAVERRIERPSAATAAPREQPGDAGGEEFWLLRALEDRIEQLDPPDGLIALVGSISGDAGPVQWQQGLAVEALAEGDWSLAAETVAALAHPARLRILQLIYRGTDSVAALTEQRELGTTGQIHHHLRPLLSAGWLESSGRGRYRVPAGRRVPLLAIMLAARG